MDGFDYWKAFVREWEKGRYNLVLAVKGFPRADIGIPTDVGMALADAVFREVEKMTPRQVMQLFPITKTYDGVKWGEKDYFYTMNVMKRIMGLTGRLMMELLFCGTISIMTQGSSWLKPQAICLRYISGRPAEIWRWTSWKI